MRQAGVAEDDVDHVLDDLTAAREADGREDESLLEDVRRAGVVVPRHRAAHVVPVADGRQPAEDAAVVEVRPDKSHVGQMRSADMGVVEDPDVAVGNVALARLLDHGRHAIGHDAHEDRQARFALHQRRARLGVVDPVGGVVRLGDDRVEGRAEERRVHLVGDLLHPARENRKRDRIDGAHALVFVSAMSFQTSCRMKSPPSVSNRSTKRMPSNAVPLSHSPWSVPNA